MGKEARCYYGMSCVRTQGMSQADCKSLAGRGILLVIDRFLQGLYLGGTERHLRALIPLLQDQGASVTVCALSGKPWEAERVLGCAAHFAQINSLVSPRGITNVLRWKVWMSEQGFDCVQTFLPESSWVGPLVAKWAGVPVVIGSRRNLNHWLTPKYQVLLRLANPLVDLFMANSEAVKHRVIATEGVDGNKICVCYNMLDLDAFRHDAGKRRAVREQLGVAPDQVLIGTVANLRPVKGLQYLVVAAGLVHRKYPGARFAVVGEGPMLAQLQALAQAEGLSGILDFCDMQEDVAAYLSAFDIAVHSSLAEGFSNAVLEYLAAGLPVVATAVGGNPEALGDAGVLVPAEDTGALAEAIMGLIQQKSDWPPMRQRALARAEQFDRDVSGQRLIQQYVDVLCHNAEWSDDVTAAKKP